MDSGCGTCTTELTAVTSSVVSQTMSSEPLSSRPPAQQLSGHNGSQQQAVGAGLGSVRQPPTKRPPLVPQTTVPAMTCQAKPQRQQTAISRYCCETNTGFTFVTRN